MRQIDGTILTTRGAGYPKKMETDTKEKQIIDSSTNLLTETMEGLSKSPRAYWQLPIVLFSVAISLSITAIALKFDPNLERKKPMVRPDTQDLYKGLKRPEYDDLKSPACTRRGDGFNCVSQGVYRSFA
jgi:hypothetical protein